MAPSSKHPSSLNSGTPPGTSNLDIPLFDSGSGQVDLFTNFNTREYVRDGGYVWDNVDNNLHSSTLKLGCRVLWGGNGIEERFALRRGGG